MPDKYVVESPISSRYLSILNSPEADKCFSPPINNVKIVLVGDTTVGKSSLISTYLKNRFIDTYEPTVLDVYKGTKKLHGTDIEIELEIHDTSGERALSRER